MQTLTSPVRDLRLAAAGMLGAAAVWPALPVHPPLACPLRSATGIPCPFCGMTRAVVAAVHGDVVTSLRFNPAGLLVLAIAVVVLVRPRIVSSLLRTPLWLLGGGSALLWAYNVVLNPTFT